MCMSGNAVYLESSCKMFYMVVMDCNSCKITHIDQRSFIKLIAVMGTEHRISTEQNEVVQPRFFFRPISRTE